MDRLLSITIYFLRFLSFVVVFYYLHLLHSLVTSNSTLHPICSWKLFFRSRKPHIQNIQKPIYWIILYKLSDIDHQHWPCIINTKRKKPVNFTISPSWNDAYSTHKHFGIDKRQWKALDNVKFKTRTIFMALIKFCRYRVKITSAAG